MPVAIPWLPTSLPIVATPLLVEDQNTDARASALPSWNAPVAMNLWLAPTETDALAGTTVINISPGGACILGW